MKAATKRAVIGEAECRECDVLASQKLAAHRTKRGGRCLSAGRPACYPACYRRNASTHVDCSTLATFHETEEDAAERIAEIYGDAEDSIYFPLAVVDLDTGEQLSWRLSASLVLA